MSNKMVSVVILNYNGKKLGKIFESCIESVLKTDYPNFEVILVDNASTDGSPEFVKEKFGADKRLRIISNAENLGYAEGNNVGMRKAKGEYIALLNSDTRVDPAWLKELVNAIQPADVAAAQSKLLLMDRPNLLDCAGGIIDYYGYHDFEAGLCEDAEKYNHVYEIFYSKGAAMIVKREALNRVGLFDPVTFVFFDETDLCWRIRLAGYKILFVPSSLVWHVGSMTASKLQDKARVYFYTRNHFALVIKNFGTANMLKASAVTLIRELRNMGKHILKRDYQKFTVVTQALFWNLVNFPDTWSKRLVAQHIIRRITDDSIKKFMLKPYPPFPSSLLFSRKRYPDLPTFEFEETL